MPFAVAPLAPPARSALRAWLLLAVGALAAAGFLALLLAASRTPGLGGHLPWGPDFFFRGLVTHVVLAFQVWFLAMLAAAAVLAAPSAAAQGGTALAGIAAAGVLLLLVPTLAGWGEPSLNNYVPVLDHPLFFAGLAVLAAAVGLSAVRTLAAPEPWTGGPAGFAIAMAAAGFLAALACFAMVAALIPAGTDAPLRDERLFWGSGHVLQFVNTMLLMAGWQALAECAFGRGPLPPALARATVAALALACLAAPLLVLRLDVLGLAGRQAFTQLLWYALPLPPLVMGGGVAVLLLRTRLDWRNPAVLALAGSLAVFALGGGAGFALGAGDTRTPAHYHAEIGAVMLVLMGLVQVVMLPALGRAPRAGSRVLRLQFHLFGGGQLLHAAGFYLAGAAGAPRKTAGLEQGLHGFAQLAGMAVVGLGGAVAVAGGVLFVVQVLARLLKREAADAA
jgi:hypothetical protein